MRRIDVREGGEALDAHRRQVAVRHRVPDECNLQSGVEQRPADLAARLALAAAGARRADRDDRLRGAEHRRIRAEEAEVRSRGEDDRRLVHHGLVLQVGVREHDLVDAVLADELRELVLGADLDAVGVQRAGEHGRIDAIVDPGDLGRGEGDDLGLRVVTERDVEVVEVASAGSHDDQLAHCSLLSPALSRARSRRVLSARCRRAASRAAASAAACTHDAAKTLRRRSLRGGPWTAATSSRRTPGCRRAGA